MDQKHYAGGYINREHREQGYTNRGELHALVCDKVGFITPYARIYIKDTDDTILVKFDAPNAHQLVFFMREVENKHKINNKLIESAGYDLD